MYVYMFVCVYHDIVQKINETVIYRVLGTKCCQWRAGKWLTGFWQGKGLGLFVAFVSFHGLHIIYHLVRF